MPVLWLLLQPFSSCAAPRQGSDLCPEQTRTIGTLRTHGAAAPKKLREKQERRTHAVPRRSSSMGTRSGAPAGMGPCSRARSHLRHGLCSAAASWSAAATPGVCLCVTK